MRYGIHCMQFRNWVVLTSGSRESSYKRGYSARAVVPYLFERIFSQYAGTRTVLHRREAPVVLSNSLSVNILIKRIEDGQR